MSDTPLLFETDGAVATITFNRPEIGNLIDLPTVNALFRAAIVCECDPSIRVVVMRSNGKMFSAGGDLSAFKAAGEGRPVFMAELAGTLHMALFRLLRMRKPMITLVHGPAAGAGFSLALGGDICLVGPNAHFTAAYGKAGLSPDGGMSWLLPRMVGMRKAQEIIITNRRVSAQEAVDIGIATRMVDEDNLFEEGMQLATQLGSAATDAIGAARGLLLDSFDGTLEAHLERETRAITNASGSADCEEGISAFFEQRSANFTGR